MGAPVLQFKRGQFSNLPGLRAGEPGFTTDKFDLYVGIDSTTSSNKFFGSHRYWNRETATVGSSVRVVEGSNNGSNYIELKSPNSLAQNVSYTLPATDVANGILVSDGSGNLSYTTTVTGSGSGLSAGTVPLASLDIDGGTDIGAALSDGDLLIVDDGAGGTNRKTALSRVKTYVLGGGSGATFAAINVTGIGTVGFADASQLKVSGVSTFTGAIDANGNLDVAGTATFATPLANSNLANDSVSFGGVSVDLGASDATPAFDLSDATNYPTSSLSGTITNAQLAGSIANDKLAGSIANNKLANSTVSFGGISLALGASDATPAFDLSDATNYPTGSLSGTISNGQLAGSIADSKLNTITTANKVGLGAIDIDGGTDIGADLVDADLLIVDDGAGGTNRKTAMSRVKNYVLGGGSGATFAQINVTGIGSVAFTDATQLKVSGISTFTGQTNHSTINASSTVTGTAFHTGAEGSAIRVTSNTISGPATITLDPAGVGDNTGKVVIAGDFQVDGTTTTVNSTTMTVDDKNLELGTGAANDAAANGGGITIVSGEGNKTFQFEATGDNLGSSENLNIASGKDYKVNNVSVLNATTLGSSVVASSLTSVGNLTTLDVTGATNLNATTQSTSNTTGALIVDGGVGIAKNVNIGEALDVDGQITSGAPLRNSTGSGLIPGVGIHSASSSAGLVTAFKFRGSGLEDFIVADGTADIVLTGVAATTTTTSQTFTATQGQTTFTVSAGYSAGFLDVYLNGIRLITGTDYTASNGSTFVLASGAVAGDELEAVAWKGLGQVTNLQSLSIVDNLSVTGVITATGGVVGNLTGDITGSGANLTAGTVPLSSLDIDGGTATTALANADLFIVDDGANGTNRKVTFETLSSAVLGGSGGANFSAINVSGIGTFGGNLDVNANADISGNVVVGGDLTVNGTTTQINTVNTTIEDTLLELQKVDGGNLSSDTNKDVGIVMNYYDGSAKKAAFFWDDSAGRFAFGSVVTETSGVLGSITYGGVEIGALHVNDCAGASQVISCSGTTRSLENITIDGGSF